MEKNSKKKGLKFWLQLITIALIGFQGVWVGVAFATDFDTGKTILLRMSGWVLFELALFLIANYLDISDNQARTNTQIAGLDETIDKQFADLDETIKTVNNASIEILKTRDEFYEKLNKSRKDATEKVSLTQLDPWPPSGYEEEGARQTYFNADVEFAKANPRVTIRRILSIERQDKLDWAKDLIEKTKGLSNVHLAYINIPHVEKAVPFPKILSLQIIDSEEVFHLNPQYHFMPRQYKTCFYVKNKDLASIYEDYYDEVWRKIQDDKTSNFEIGCILKDGSDDKGYDEKLNEIKKKFTNTPT